MKLSHLAKASLMLSFSTITLLNASANQDEQLDKVVAAGQKK